MYNVGRDFKDYIVTVMVGWLLASLMRRRALAVDAKWASTHAC
jgi:hypothetical protein